MPEQFKSPRARRSERLVLNLTPEEYRTVALIAEKRGEYASTVAREIFLRNLKLEAS